MEQVHHLKRTRSTKPLLQSRNASVVMATAQLYHHCAPAPEVQVRESTFPGFLFCIMFISFIVIFNEYHYQIHHNLQVVAKAMIRLLRSHDEVQAVVLNAIASMTSSRRKSRNSMFEPFLRYLDASSLSRSVLKSII